VSKSLPDKLRIVDGELVMVDGSDVRAYLREWAEQAKVTANTPVNIMRREAIDDYRQKADMLMHWAS
jgi:hypothetical protein